MSTAFSFDIFLSHNVNDKQRVRSLAERLRAEGFRVWFDEWAIKPGDDIYLAVEHGLESARVLVLCLSEHALASDWVRMERSTVLFRDPSNVGRRFIPLLLDDCKLPDSLRRFKYVDFRQEVEGAFLELVEACRVADQESPAITDISQSSTVQGLQADNKDQPPVELLAVLKRKFKAHASWIYSVAVSPKGEWLASCSKDETVKLWSMNGGVYLTTLKGHTEDVNCVDFTTDGNSIVSSSDDKTIRIWDRPTGRIKHILSGHSGTVDPVVALTDGKRLLSGATNDDKSIKLWNIQTGACLKTIKTEQTIWTAAANASGTRAVIGGDSGKLTLWDLDAAECLASLKGHSDIVYSVQMTADQMFAVSGSEDKTVKIWSLATASCVASLEGHQSAVMSVALSPDDRIIVSTGLEDKTVRLWDLKSGDCLQVIKYNKNLFPTSVAFSPDGSRLVVGTYQGLIYIYSLNKLKAITVAEPARRYSNAKVVLIGESGVGKTTLAHRLIADDYVKTESTHGMNVWHLDLPDAESSDLPNENEGPVIEREALLWDLAGQEDYRLIHQLYLEETALALMLVNPQKDDPFAEASDWLKALSMSVSRNDPQREVAKLLIATRLDVGGMKLSRQKIDRFLQEHGFAGFLETSANRGDNCSDSMNGDQPSTLKQLIAQHIPWDQLPWTSTPRLLAELKNALVALRDDGDIRLLRFAELAQRLEQALPNEAITEANMRTAVTLLANHGLLRPLKFGDLVLLRPELLNGYAAAVIRAARCHRDEIGCVSEEAVFSDEFDFTGVERLQHRPDEELLLRALLQMLLDSSLCMRVCEENGQWLLIFPSQYRRDRDIPKYPEIFVSYTFSGELQTIYTTLVVRLWYSRSFDQKELWQNAAEFTTSTGKTIGVLFEKLGDGAGKISVFFETGVPDELKLMFIEFVHRHLAKRGRELQRQRRYVCNCGEPVTNLALVQERQALGKKFIICQRCDKRVQFMDHIEKRLASDPVARKVLLMEQTERQQRDTQSEEQGLIGHMMAVCADANAIFRPVTMFDYGIDGEVEFKDPETGAASGRKIYVQLKSGNSYLRSRKRDGKEIFDVTNDRHLQYWQNQPVDVYLVIRQHDEMRGEDVIRWMNVSAYLKQRQGAQSKQLIFSGEKLDFAAVWRVRDGLFA
ncbi:TIR domain-containing protein [Methylobacter sp.]|uniref:TIR domain-containing protein n=1 Tax=Methylobacter sp. TaxID=2051955 RepID=UPI0025F7FE0A|nr:TIR domain-containing protein [Methylobacter sp.]